MAKIHMTKYIRTHNVRLPGGYVNDSTTDASIGAQPSPDRQQSF